MVDAENLVGGLMGQMGENRTLRRRRGMYLYGGVDATHR